ncbi:MAG TPA: ATP-binding protein [Luteibaculaceae bacterium]|nr:ATP-binding protein [Luteibaculaceae bacterium]
MTTSTKSGPSAIKGLWVFSLILFLQLGANAQLFNYYFSPLNNDLPQQFIYALERDNDGYLWIGTGEGLVKFDGSRVISLKRDRKVITDFCTALCNTSKGMIAGFYDGSLAIQTGNELTSISTASDGQIIAIASDGTTHYAITSTQVLQFTKGQASVIRQLKDESYRFTGIAWFRNQLYVGTDQGLKILNPSSNKWISANNTPVTKLETTKDKLYFSSGSTIYDASQINRPKVVFSDSTIITPITHFRVESTGIYLLYDHILRVASNTTSRIFPLPDSNVRAQCLAVVDGNVWIGTYGSGIAYFKPGSHSYRPSADKYAETSIQTFLTEDELIDVRQFGIAITPLENGQANYAKTSTYKSPQQISAACLFGDEIYLGTTTGNVQLFSVLTRKTKAVNAYQGPRKTILDIAIQPDKLWISVQFNGVYVVDLKTRKSDHYTTENGLLNNDINKILPATNGTVWFLSRGSGLAYRNKNQFGYYTLSDGLPSLDLTDAAEDGQANIWITTEGGGLAKIDASGIQSFRKESGLSSDYLTAVRTIGDTIVVSSRGAINILVGNRLRKIETNELTYNPNFANKSMAFRDRTIAVGSDFGPHIQTITDLWPENVLRLKVGSILIDDKSTYYGNLELDYADYKVQFNVDKINLNPFYNPDLEFMLEGFDKEWQDVTKLNIIYQSIKDNEYRFRVRDKSYPKNEAWVTVSVEQPYWKKPITYVLAALAIALLIWITLKIRLQQLRQRNKELEVKVRERTAQLQRKNQELEQFTFAISHDLKNPAINMVELVKLMDGSDAASNEALQKTLVEQLGNVSKKMLRNLLDLIELLKYAGTDELPKERVNLHELIEDVKAGIAPDKLNGLAKLTVDLGGFTHLYANRSNLQSIFQNLISNAIKYRKPDVPAEVSIRTRLEKDRAFIDIRDNGMGIDLQKHGERLFGIFQRLHHHVEGSGIGLHLVKSMVEKNGGVVTVQSEVNQGTCFTLQFEGKLV